MKGYMKQRGKTSYRIAVYTGTDPVTGKKNYHYETISRPTLAKAEKAAQARMVEILKQVNDGTWVEPAKGTFGEYLAKKWLPQQAPPKLEQATYDMYEYLCRVHIIPALGNVPLRKLTAMMLDSFYTQKLREPKQGGKGHLSPRTVRHMHNVIHIALQQALKWGLVARNVADAATPPSIPKKRPDTWTAEETARFLESVKDDKYYAAFLLALQAGLRRGEIFGLRWQDIDFEAGTAKIVQAVVKTSQGNVLKPPKTDGSSALVALSDATLNALREHRIRQLRARREYEALCGPGSYRDADLVFAREDGHFLDPNAFGRYFKRRVRKAGLREIRVHDQRHTAATLMLEAGNDLKTVSDQLRHTRISTTAESYIGSIPISQRRAAKAMDGLLGLSDSAKTVGWPKDGQKPVQ